MEVEAKIETVTDDKIKREELFYELNLSILKKLTPLDAVVVLMEKAYKTKRRKKRVLKLLVLLKLQF